MIIIEEKSWVLTNNVFMDKTILNYLRQGYRNLIKGMETLVFPPQLNCPICKGKLFEEKFICINCQRLLIEWQEKPKCLHCNSLIKVRGEVCQNCLKEPPAFKLAMAVAPYEGVFSEAIKRFKFNGERWLAEPLAWAMAELVRNNSSFENVDLLIPVPLSKKRLRERGFNQSLDLAKQLGRALNLPVQANVLAKIKETKDQIGLSRIERKTNLKDAFGILKPQIIQAASILLVDDILTTGSTAHHSSLSLINGGAKEVKVITWAGVSH